VTDWGRLRRLLSRGGCAYARTILGLPQRDLTGGYKLLHRRVLEAIALQSVRSQGYVFQIEITYRAVLAGFRVEEVPIVFRERDAGRSKMSGRIALEAMWRVPGLRRTARGAVARVGGAGDEASAAA
jgi:dolichol-phosphate mannosyltransferase